MRTLAVLSCLLTVLASIGAAEDRVAPANAQPDDRYKADILLVMAHPDDETGDVAAYLARAIDQHRRVAVVCVTRGDAGTNSAGLGRQTALGAVREIEGRRAFAFLQISNVWFLNGLDTPEQDVLSSLEHWDHGSVLGQVVRLIRLTRPEVIFTWLPALAAGENHADHQATSVIATEAFDLAGDPAAFAEQLGAPREALTISAEGLRPWQPKKLYYYSDAFDEGGFWVPANIPPSPFRKNFLEGAGPEYPTTDMSPSRHVSYAQLSAEEDDFYMTQRDWHNTPGKKPLGANVEDFQVPLRLVFGKSLVKSSTNGDVFEGILPGEIPFTPPQKLAAAGKKPAVELGGSWAFYREFWKAHDLQHLTTLLSVPEIVTKPEWSAKAETQRIHIPLVIHNNSDAAQSLRLTSALPTGWSDISRYQIYPVAAGDTYALEANINVPDTEPAGWREVTWTVAGQEQTLGTVKLRILVTRKSAASTSPNVASQ